MRTGVGGEGEREEREKTGMREEDKEWGRAEGRRKKGRKDGRGWKKAGRRWENVGNKQEGKRKEEEKVISTLLLGTQTAQSSRSGACPEPRLFILTPCLLSVPSLTSLSSFLPTVPSNPFPVCPVLPPKGSPPSPIPWTQMCWRLFLSQSHWTLGDVWD